MADTGWVVAGSGTSVPVTGGLEWGNPNNITTETDSTVATVAGLVDYNSAYLVADNFGFAIPSGAGVTGVEVRVRCKADLVSGPGAASFSATSGMLVVSGVAVGANRFTGMAAWDTAFSNRDGGGSSDLWGVTLAPSDVNAADFGFRFQGSGSAKNRGNISSIWMRIHFDEASGGGVFARDGGVWKEGSAYVRDGGIWKPSQQYVRDGGIWKS